MTPPGGGAPSGEDASVAVGYTYPQRSYRRPESTGRGPGIASGAPTSGAPVSPSTSTASPDLVTVAALYVERGGVYYGLEAVDPWDEERDARLYDGPHPVVAHPPCNRWSQLCYLVEHVHGYKAGDDGGCFEHALDCVRRFGGVLEHPAETRAWRHYGLPRPATKGGWTVTLDGESVCYVEQETFGHRARKPTWLYAYGVELPELPWQSRPVLPDDVGWYVDKRRGQVKHGPKRLRDASASCRFTTASMAHDRAWAWTADIEVVRVLVPGAGMNEAERIKAGADHHPRVAAATRYRRSSEPETYEWELAFTHPDAVAYICDLAEERRG